MAKEKIVLAYSGGLDTSVILKWLIDKDFEVVAYIANVGQEEDFEAAKEKALLLGASKVYIEDLQKELVTDFVFPAIKANAIYEGRYMLGTSLARPIIAKRQIEIAEIEKAGYVGHGATGKGNDQVRFELTFYALNPKIKVIAPWKMQEFLDQFKGRTDMLNYAEAKGIPVKASLKKPYSEDDNLIHISHEAGILEDPKHSWTADMLTKMVSPQAAPDKETKIEIHFKAGVPVKVVNHNDKTTVTEPLQLINYLNKIGGENGIGLCDMVENRFVGLKSRGVYETPGYTILRTAHMDIEGITMDREVMKLRNMMSEKFSDLIYNGFWYSPEGDFLLSIIDKSQENIDGIVYLTLYKGNVLVNGRESDKSLYNQDLSSMDIAGGFDQKDSAGFIKINAVRLMANNLIRNKK